MILTSGLAKNRTIRESLSIFSQFYHFVYFSVIKWTSRLKQGVLITSIDVDSGSRLIGINNQGKNDHNVHDYLSERIVGEIEEKAVPLLIQFFDQLEIPVTFALRGQLTETKSNLIELLLRSAINHDIGAHGYYHKTFTSLSENEAQKELQLISIGFRKFGIEPKSFVFPKNKIAYLPLLEKFKYKCYRSAGSLTKDGMYIKKTGQLYDIHPSFYLGFINNTIFLNQIIDLAIKHRLPVHFWFHPHNLSEARGSTRAFIRHVLFPLYKYAKKKEDQGLLTIETMHSVINKIKPTSSGKEHEF